MSLFIDTRRHCSLTSCKAWTDSSLHAFDWRCSICLGHHAQASNRPFKEDIRKIPLRARFVQRFTTKRQILTLRVTVPGTVISDLAKSRAEIEGARLLVLSAALQASTASGRFILDSDSLADRQVQAKGRAQGDWYRQGKMFVRFFNSC